LFISKRYVVSAYPFYFVSLIMFVSVVFVCVIFILHSPNKFGEKGVFKEKSISEASKTKEELPTPAHQPPPKKSTSKSPSKTAISKKTEGKARAKKE
jgi:hypothetical protein